MFRVITILFQWKQRNKLSLIVLSSSRQHSRQTNTVILINVKGYQIFGSDYSVFYAAKCKKLKEKTPHLTITKYVWFCTCRQIKLPDYSWNLFYVTSFDSIFSISLFKSVKFRCEKLVNELKFCDNRLSNLQLYALWL